MTLCLLPISPQETNQNQEARGFLTEEGLMSKALVVLMSPRSHRRAMKAAMKVGMEDTGALILNLTIWSSLCTVLLTFWSLDF